MIKKIRPKQNNKH